jgi:hypothetical protein
LSYTTDMTTTLENEKETVESFPAFLRKEVKASLSATFPKMAAEKSAVLDALTKSTVKAMQTGSQRGLLDEITEKYVQKYQYKAPEAPSPEVAPTSAPAPVAVTEAKAVSDHPHNTAFGSAFEKMGEAVEKTQAEPTRTMKARLAMGLSTFGVKAEKAMNGTMAYAVPAVGMFGGAVGGLTGALVGFAQNDPVMMYGSLGGGAAVAAASSQAMTQGMMPGSMFRKFTAKIREKCDEPFKAIQARAQEQGRDWTVTKADVGDPEPKVQAPMAEPAMAR